jgi:hypothetical protein
VVRAQVEIARVGLIDETTLAAIGGDVPVDDEICSKIGVALREP